MRDETNALIEEHGYAPEELNYRDEMRLRQVPFHPGSAGSIKYQRIPMCGHKFVPGHEPRHRNCETCWFTFFQAHGELTQSCDEVFSKLGEDALRQLKPGKFTRNFLKFMSTLAQWKTAAKPAQETDVEDSTSTASGSGGDTAATIGSTETEPTAVL